MSHPSPEKRKLEKTEPQRKSEAAKPTQKTAAKVSTADTHRDLPEQRAAWEGMTASKPQQGSGAATPDEDGAEVSDEELEDTSRLEGEGSYSAAREYNRGVKASLAEGKVGERAHKAKEAIDGAEAEELRRAERVGKSKRAD